MGAYYRRAASVLKLVRFAVLLGFVVFAVFCIGFFKDNITVDNLRYLLKYLDLSAADNTPSEAEITLDNSGGTAFALVGNDLAVLDKNGISLYDFAGNKLYRYDMPLASPAMVAGGRNLLVYDTDGKTLAMFDAVSKVLEKSFDYDVKAACLNDLGCFAVITAEKTYRSGVVVFDSDGKELFRWMSPDKYLTGVALNANATVVTCTALTNKDGAFCTELGLLPHRYRRKDRLADVRGHACAVDRLRRERRLCIRAFRQRVFELRPRIERRRPRVVQSRKRPLFPRI